MTKHLHRNEDLIFNDFTVRSLQNLSKESKKICLSGEGDPLVVWQNIIKLIENGPNNSHYELITSSFWNQEKTKNFLQEISKICEPKECTLAYRISIDKFHEEEISRDVLNNIITVFISNTLSNINLQIRSITGQENYLFNRINSIFENRKIKLQTEQINDITYLVKSKSIEINIQFKPTVKPSDFEYIDEWNIKKYIGFLEKSRNTDFHIGMIEYSNEQKVYDVTINPNGDVVLYGLEPFILGNITKELVSYDLIEKRVQENELLNSLTMSRFIDIINEWKKDKERKSIIENVNNPFWVVRNLFENNQLTI